MKGVFFDIDSITGLLYANYFGDLINEKNIPRMLANDFIRKYVGEMLIKELAVGYYLDIDNKGTLDFNPCENSNIGNKNNIFLKINYKDW